MKTKKKETTDPSKMTAEELLAYAAKRLKKKKDWFPEATAHAKKIMQGIKMSEAQV